MAQINDTQLLKYLDLVKRRMFITLHSCINWKPEYSQEFVDIDKEISSLRKFTGRINGYFSFFDTFTNHHIIS